MISDKSKLTGNKRNDKIVIIQSIFIIIANEVHNVIYDNI